MRKTDGARRARGGAAHAGAAFGMAPPGVASREARIASDLGILLAGHAHAGPGWAAARDRIGADSATAQGMRVLVRQLRARTSEQIEDLWRRGWQPADLHRIVTRHLGSEEVALLGDAMAAQLQGYAVATLAPRWPGQLQEAGARVWWEPRADPLDVRAADDPAGPGHQVFAAIRLLGFVSHLGRLEILDPLPGQARPRRDGPAVDERVLAKVRAMLAKAESTPYEAEADAFTAAAQTLMARHSIDAALLADSDPGRQDGARGIRIGIDRPYERPKVLLLDAVARANRCRSVWASTLGFVTVIGHETDLAAAETIFTSLLVQATRAMTAEGSRLGYGGRSRTRSFRGSFLTSFALRIGERLSEAAAQATESAIRDARALSDRDGQGADGAATPVGEADASRALVRVLEVRSAEVDAAFEEFFPEVRKASLGTASDPEGWLAGRQAADAASLVDGTSRLTRGAPDGRVPG